MKIKTDKKLTLQNIMEFTFYTEPVTFCIIRNFYKEDEIDLIHKELDNISCHFGGPEKTGTAKNIDGGHKKENKGVFLDQLYGPHRDQSSILKLNRKIFSPEVRYELSKGNWFFKYLNRIAYDTTLVSTYHQGQYYKTHEDQSFITAIYYIWKEPKAFEGGDLYLGDVKIPIENNCLLVFPSNTEHRVDPVTKGSGRFAISQFINFDKPFPQPEIHRFMNFLTVNEFDIVCDKIHSNKSWSQHGQSVAGGSRFGHLDLMSDAYFTEFLVNKIRSITGINLRLERVYANGQFFGQNGSFHQDADIPDKFTFVLYINKINDIDKWGGETQFRFYEDKIISYQPETNSALLFDSRLWHRGMGPNKHVDEMRITIAWKFGAG